MPAFTATSWTTFVRRAVSTVRQQVVHKTASKAVILGRNRALQFARQAIEETFPSVSQPTFQRLQPRLATLPIPIHPLRQAGQNVRMGGFRFAPHHPRGPAIVARVGLNPSRGFASSTVGGATPGAHMVLRAFASTIDDPSLPRWSPVVSYPPRKHQPRRHRRKLPHCLLSRQNNVDVGPKRSIRDIEYYFTPPQVAEFAHYFPIRGRAPVVAPTPILPEMLVTPDVYTTLQIALDPVEDDSRSTLEVSYAAAEVGVTVFSDLLRGIIPLMQAFSSHASTKVNPLLYRLQSLGVFDETGDTTPKISSVQLDGVASALSITFPNRSIDDVRALLGEVSGEGDWYQLSQVSLLREAEVVALTEHWSDRPSSPLGQSVAMSGPTDSMSSSASRSVEILDAIPDLGISAYSTEECSSEAEDGIYDVGMSSAELVIPHIDLSQSTVTYRTTFRPSVPLAPATYAPPDVEASPEVSRVWSDLESSASSVHSPWSVPSSDVDDLESILSDMEENDDSLSLPSSPVESRPPSPDSGWESGYGVMLPF
ncbi:hypothetical protein DB88DRAFT_501686 [Papiliotrema laurentii]|uniref:Uncharacterized protein n=1 Tax=Papiliotrema laurentii TaxID=5418 RepID=A0AAD9CUS1_PAPLA|nr:hypothetical protein DB88DRAFT_501686 [Papiliotrema laurentii]